MQVLLPAEVVHSAAELQPKIALSPFTSSALEFNQKIVESNSVREIDWASVQPCTHDHVALTQSGTSAIRLVLGALELDPDDEVLICTTNGTPYISGCVTREIEKVCRWSRTVSKRTRCVFLIHNFGFRASLPENVRDMGLPVIEDCAYAFGSSDCGSVGDFVIYSFSKAFPVPFGGLLLANRPVTPDSNLSSDGQQYLERVLAYYLEHRAKAFERRQQVFLEYRSAFTTLGFEPKLVPEHAEIPHAFVLEFPDEARARRVRQHMNAAGIESSVYYGSGGYYLPCHQALGPSLIAYVVAWFSFALQQEAPRERTLSGA